jgi:hypothetical protein
MYPLTLILLTLTLYGCTNPKVAPQNPDTMPTVTTAEEITYYDRNGDGIVDREKHHFPGAADMDWELRDENYDGKFEKKILYGVGVIESVVNLPVPTNVTIKAKE